MSISFLTTKLGMRLEKKRSPLALGAEVKGLPDWLLVAVECLTAEHCHKAGGWVLDVIGAGKIVTAEKKACDSLNTTIRTTNTRHPITIPTMAPIESPISRSIRK